jgi:hypothetical protein
LLRSIGWLQSFYATPIGEPREESSYGLVDKQMNQGSRDSPRKRPALARPYMQHTVTWLVVTEPVTTPPSGEQVPAVAVAALYRFRYVVVPGSHATLFM